MRRPVIDSGRSSRSCPSIVIRPESGQTSRPSASAKASAPLPFPGRYLQEPRRDFFKIGAALLWGGYPQQALPYLQAALDRAPQSQRILLLVAQIHLEGKRTAQARKLLQEALSADPVSAEAWNELGGVEMAEDNPKAAIECYRKALDSKPDLTYTLLNAAHAYGQTGDQATAEKFYRRALELDPSLADAANNPAVQAEVQRAIDHANKSVSRAESIRKFTILPTEWTEASGHLTPKMSIKRNVIMDDFSADIDELYSAP